MTRREAQELLAEMIAARDQSHKYMKARELLSIPGDADDEWNKLGDLALAQHRRFTEMQLRIISAMCGE